MSSPPALCWVDGRLQPAESPALRADDSAYRDGRGCYTSVLVRDGAPRWVPRHLRRLARGAAAIGLPRADERRLRRALEELSAAVFPGRDGAIRLQLSGDTGGGLHVVGIPRELGDEDEAWRALSASFPHPGPELHGGHKLAARFALARAADEARAAGADEALLFDAAGRLVEGSRSNLLVLREDGRLCTPPEERGAVAGIALEVASEHLPELCRRDLSRRELFAARGVIAVNALRGARRLASLDGRALGDAGAELARRVGAILEEE